MNNLKNLDDKLLSCPDVISKTGVTRMTLWRWEKTNVILPKRIGGRTFYTQDDVDVISILTEQQKSLRAYQKTLKQIRTNNEREMRLATANS